MLTHLTKYTENFIICLKLSDANPTVRSPATDVSHKDAVDKKAWPRNLVIAGYDTRSEMRSLYRIFNERPNEYFLYGMANTADMGLVVTVSRSGARPSDTVLPRTAHFLAHHQEKEQGRNGSCVVSEPRLEKLRTY